MKQSALRSEGRVGRPKGSSANLPKEQQARERLLAAALEMFARGDYESVSTTDIANAAGFSQSMVHYHFGTKLDLWKAAIRSLMDRRGTEWRVLEIDGADPLERLKILISRYTLLHAEDPTLARLMIQEGGQESVRLTWFVNEFVREGMAVFDDAIRAAIDAGQVRDLGVPELVMTILTSSAYVFTQSAMIREVFGIDLDEPASLARMVDTVTSMIFDGITA